MDEQFEVRFGLLTIDEQIVACRNILYEWYTGWCLFWLLVLEVLVIIDAACEVDVPRWLYVTFIAIAAWTFLNQRSWAINNGMGCLNLLFWPLFALLLVVEAPFMGVLWLLNVMFSPKLEFGKWAFAISKIVEFKRRKLIP